VVYGVLRTADAVSPVSAGPVSVSLLAFMVVYAIIFGAGALYILRLMAVGPVTGDTGPDNPNRAPGNAMAAAPPEPREAGP